MKKIILSSAILALAASFSASADTTYSCKHDSSERLITVAYPEGGELPCEVQYTKGDDIQILWNAKNVKGYCEEKAAAFVDKQTGWGWSCSEVK